MNHKPHRFIFLDRDGVINQDTGYVHTVNAFVFKPLFLHALQILHQHGYQFIVVTNQSGIARGYFTQSDYDTLSSWLKNTLMALGIPIRLYHCPHLPEHDCECRKPKPGLFLKAKQELGISMETAWMIGDQERDIQAAIAAGIQRHIFFSEQDHSALAKITCQHWSDIYQHILKTDGLRPKKNKKRAL